MRTIDMGTIDMSWSAGRDQRAPGERRAVERGPDRPFDEVHDAALDSFPASDPPSWSPIRIGTPVI